MGDPVLVKEMLLRYSPRRFSLKFFLLCLAFVMGVLASMGLRKPSGDDGILRKGIDVVIALDLSSSMLAKDVAPSRLEMARQFVSQLIRSMPQNRVGLVLFAGKAYLQTPISSDHGAVQMFVANASPDLLPVKGTVLASALEESLRAFNDYEAKYKAVVLISDGEDHDEKALQLSKDMAARGLMVNTVGIGSPQGAFVPDTSGRNKIDPATGREVVSKLNEAELQQIAANTHGGYVHLTSIPNAIKLVTASLAQIDKKVTGDTHLMGFTYYFWLFGAAMAVLLVVEQLLPECGTNKK